MSSGDYFQRWRVANREAAVAADAIFEKLVLAVEAGGEPPSKAEADEVSRLRHVADEEFAAAMAELREAMHGAAGCSVRRPPVISVH